VQPGSAPLRPVRIRVGQNANHAEAHFALENGSLIKKFDVEALHRPDL
jgi:hypothetical protein